MSSCKVCICLCCSKFFHNVIDALFSLQLFDSLDLLVVARDLLDLVWLEVLEVDVHLLDLLFDLSALRPAVRLLLPLPRLVLQEPSNVRRD